MAEYNRGTLPEGLTAADDEMNEFLEPEVPCSRCATCFLYSLQSYEFVYNPLAPSSAVNKALDCSMSFPKSVSKIKGACVKNSRATLCLFVGILLVAASVGCGSGDSTPPHTAISPSSNPLVAQYNITHVQPELAAWVEFGTDTHYGRQTSVMTDLTWPVPHGGHVLTVLVAGMRAQTTYHMRAHVEWPSGSWVDQDQTFTTGALPAPLSLPQVSVSPSTPIAGLAPAPGVELLSLVEFSNPNLLQAIATDLQGNLIWYCPGQALPIKPLPNGHFIVNTNQDVREVDLACNTVRDLTMAQVKQSLQAQGLSYDLIFFSHDVLVLPNGHWICLIQIFKNYTDLPGYPGTTAVIGDVLVDVDPNGNVVWTWSAFDHMDVNRHLQGLPDWTHGNALVYTPEGNLLLSLRHQSWIIKIDYENGAGSGNILWRLGQDGDFTLLGGDPSQWFYGQHDPYLISTNGSQMNLAVFDDGNLRIGADGESCGTTTSAPACYTRAAIYQLDESTNLASLSWEYSPVSILSGAAAWAF